MLLPWLFLLLSHWPEPLPPLEDRGMFPPMKACEEQRVRIRRQMAVAQVRIALAQNVDERECWGAEHHRLAREDALWSDVLFVHAWAEDGPSQTAKLNGVPISHHFVARMYLQELREQLGPYNYYHGQLRYRNQ